MSVVKTSITGVTEINGTQIQTSCHKLLIKVTGTSLTQAQKEAIIVNVSLCSKNGTEVTIPKMPLYRLLQMESAEEGYFLDSGSEFTGVFKVAYDGNLPLSEGQYLQLDITGLIAGMTTSIYAIPVPVFDNAYIKHERLNMNTGSRKEFNIESSRYVAINLDLTASITVVYPGVGNDPSRPPYSVEYSAEELKAIARDTNDLVSVGTSNAPVFGYDELVCLDLAAATTLFITPSNETIYDCYAIKEVVIK